jgi:hypothetical protein
MRRAFLLVFALALPVSAFAASTVTVQSGPPDEQTQQLVDAERAFAKKALDTNIRDALLREHGHGSDPVPADAGEREGILPQPARQSRAGPRLVPELCRAFGHGRHGLDDGTRGSSARRRTRSPRRGATSRPVWRRDTKGKFHVLLDEGHSCPKPPQDSLTWARLPGCSRAVT